MAEVCGEPFPEKLGSDRAHEAGPRQKAGDGAHNDDDGDDEDDDIMLLVAQVWDRSVELVRRLQEDGLDHPLMHAYLMGCGGEVRCAHGHLRGSFAFQWDERRSALARPAQRMLKSLLQLAWESGLVFLMLLPTALHLCCRQLRCTDEPAPKEDSSTGEALPPRLARQSLPDAVVNVCDRLRQVCNPTPTEFDFGELLGQGCFGSVYKSTLKGQVVKTIRASSFHATERLYDELASELSNLLSMPPHVHFAQCFGWCLHGSTPALLLEEVDSAVTLCETFKMCFHDILAHDMFDILQQIVDAVEFAESKEFPLWDVHSADIRVLVSGSIKFIDWGMRFSEDSGNLVLLPESIQLPGDRLAKRAEGDGALARLVNRHVASYYFIAGCLAGERLIDCDKLEELAACRCRAEHFASRIQNMPRSDVD